MEHLGSAATAASPMGGQLPASLRLLEQISAPLTTVAAVMQSPDWRAASGDEEGGVTIVESSEGRNSVVNQVAGQDFRERFDVGDGTRPIS